MTEPFFFPSSTGVRLFGVWRAPVSSPRRVWVVCPPFAEEEKSARRTLTEICQALVKQGDATLLFSFSGCGDSEGEFAEATLERWQQDLETTITVAKERAPDAEVWLLGVRLGASLALKVSQHQPVGGLVLIEPLLNGRSFVMQMSARKKMRAQLTGGEDEAPAAASTDYEDMDGWAVTPALKNGLSSVNLQNFEGTVPEKSVLLQVGPKTQLSPPNQAFTTKLNLKAATLVMPPFWNLLDYSPGAPLISALEASLG